MQDEITQEKNFRGTTAHRCCTEAFQRYPGNGFCKKHRFDRYQTIANDTANFGDTIHSIKLCE